MSIFTVVDEGYEVEVFRSACAVVARLRDNELALSPEQEKAASAAELKRALKSSRTVRLYALDSRDWTYRVEVHGG